MIGRGGRRARIQLRQHAAITLLVCAVTPVFNVLTSEATLGSAVQGVVDGLLVTALVGGYLQFVRDGLLHPWFRELSFTKDLAISTPTVVALFLVGRGIGLVVTSLDPPPLPEELHGGPSPLRPAVLRGALGRDAVRLADESHGRRQRPALLRGRSVPPADGRGAHLPLPRPRAVDDAGRAFGERPLLRAAPPLRGRSHRPDRRVTGGDLSVRGRRGG